MKEEEHVEGDDKDGGEGEEYDAVPRIHPAVVIFVFCSVHGIWEGDEQRPGPAQDKQPPQALLLLPRGPGQQHPEEDALAQHPEVGRHHEVCRQDVQTTTPHIIL